MSAFIAKIVLELHNNMYLNKSELKKNGWSDTLIEKHLGSPDKYVVNPHKRSTKIAWYDRSKVEQAEQRIQGLLEANLNKKGKRSEAGLKAAETKRKKIMEWVESIKIDVPVLDQRELIELACYHYNQRTEGYATPGSDPQFLDRIARNFLRHEMTNYEALLAERFGKTGSTEAYQAIKAKVDIEINRTYPSLRKYLGLED